ncbi:MULTISPECIES: universal stress protein [unclassified Saccharopolyspora]|uniref:universal stress protein n=1 Tax=unclassified Saccharopolyspora TaxID=2646250 RepID=UPI001CD4B846|nr:MULTISPECIES: universal stress protein [unclassified Saccharopolyspora]MCA1190094.1 universal stress protein [Saccharopolyspora sp. 6T]MCA1196154.1 universal stress protein [Saccharopolyspora sp. 6V]MCA1226275.1 universal stress protein [Saccharopolyspora sp. 6M]MCA1278242.1 universal stress protein [Saccharopolyspora sp. 7B]
MTEADRILVGVDGSPGSRAALRWALGYADRAGGEITALIASGIPAMIDIAMPLPGEGAAEHAAAVLRQAVDETRADDGRHVRRLVIEDHGAPALLAEAASADLLVVGHRGRGGFAGALLGSVAQHCVRHAPCPVVVVRDVLSS